MFPCSSCIVGVLGSFKSARVCMYICNEFTYTFRTLARRLQRLLRGGGQVHSQQLHPHRTGGGSKCQEALGDRLMYLWYVYYKFNPVIVRCTYLCTCMCTRTRGGVAGRRMDDHGWVATFTPSLQQPCYQLADNMLAHASCRPQHQDVRGAGGHGWLLLLQHIAYVRTYARASVTAVVGGASEPRSKASQGARLSNFGCIGLNHESKMYVWHWNRSNRSIDAIDLRVWESRGVGPRPNAESESASGGDVC